MRIIEQNPLAFRLNLELTEVHECVVTSHNILYYTIRNKYQTIILAKCAKICIGYIDIRMKIYKKCRFTNTHKLYTI